LNKAWGAVKHNTKHMQFLDSGAKTLCNKVELLFIVKLGNEMGKWWIEGLTVDLLKASLGFDFFEVELGSRKLNED
jgi:hypothetical protein